MATEYEGLKLEVRRFITADFWEARSIYLHTAFEWAQLYAYVREPKAFNSGHTFEPLVEVNQIDSSSRLLLQFKSGLLLLLSNGQVEPGPAVDVGRKVFPVG